MFSWSHFDATNFASQSFMRLCGEEGRRDGEGDGGGGEGDFALVCSFRRSLEVAGGEVAGRVTKGITSSLTTCTQFQRDDELTLPMSSARRRILGPPPQKCCHGMRSKMREFINILTQFNKWHASTHIYTDGKHQRHNRAASAHRPHAHSTSTSGFLPGTP